MASKFDHISSKDLIQSGSPSLYQLKPNEENIGTLKRMTLGKKNPNTINKTILLVGETGTGKSALINTLANYAMGVKWEDDVWFQIVEDEKRSQSDTQTSDVIVYEIFGFEDKTLPYSLTIIDTPGFGDTRGNEKDDMVSERLYDLFRSENGVHEMNVVGLVLKASENRLSDRLRYIFDSVVSLFGNDMEKNIVALITHSTGVTPGNALQALKDAKIKIARGEEDEPLHFLFDNCQSTRITKKNMDGLKHAWSITEKQMCELTEFLKETSPQKLKTTVEVLNTRVELKACIQNLHERVELIEHRQREIQQTEEELKKHEQEMNDRKTFMIEVDEPYKEKEPINTQQIYSRRLGYDFEVAVCCKKCEENCHFPGCTMALTAADCTVMKRGHCTSCTGKCPVSDHVKENWIYVTKTRKVKKNQHDVIKQYAKGEANKEDILKGLKTIMEQLQEDKDRWLDESFAHVLRLEEIALNDHSLSTLVHLDFLIKKMTEKGDTEKVQKLEEMRSGMDEGTRAGMRYKYGK